jgi:hypothetical protein
MAELQRLSPALCALAEIAFLRGDHDTAIALCDRGHSASKQVTDAAYLFPFLLTGVRARWRAPTSTTLNGGSPMSRPRSPPGRSRYLPAIDYGRGLLHLTAGDLMVEVAVG